MTLPEVPPIINFYPVLEHNENFDAPDVLHLVFSHYKLNELRQLIFQLYNAALLDNSLNSSPIDRSNLHFLFVNLNDLATAAYVIALEKYLQASENSIPSSENKSNANTEI